MDPICAQVGEHVRSHGTWLPKRVTADSASTLETRMLVPNATRIAARRLSGYSPKRKGGRLSEAMRSVH